MRTRIPFGYQIIGGKAAPHPVEAQQIKTFFDWYLSGLSMKQSAALAEIRLSPGALSHTFSSIPSTAVLTPSTLH